MLKYSVISPARDEEENLGRMLDSLLEQRVLPRSIHVVDDGSSDRTPEILKAYSAKSPLINFTVLSRRGARREGGELALQGAFGEVDWPRIDVLARLDSDISFGPDFFERLLLEFERDARLGIASGLIYEQEKGRWRAKPVPDHHTRGACKLYRKECYMAIQPIGTLLGWDGQDEARANFYGWKTRNYPGAVIYHHRPVGASHGRMRYYRNLGLSAYYIGYHPLFMVARAIVAARKAPFLLGSLLMLAGMIEGYLKGLPREERKEVISFLRHQQLQRLVGRKTVCVAAVTKAMLCILQSGVLDEPPV